MIQQQSLVARQLDLTSRSLSAEAIPVAETVATAYYNDVPIVSGSGPGLLVIRPTGEAKRQLTWFDRRGRSLGTIGEADDSLISPELSPDGQRVAVERTIAGNTDIYTIDQVGQDRLTTDSARERFPVWSPDGRRIGFTRYGGERTGQYVRSSTGERSEELLVEASAPPQFNGMTAWSRDDLILFDVTDPNSSADVWLLARRPMGDTPKKPNPILDTNFQERLARFSPDGQWIAYQSNETGRAEIYVRPFGGGGRKRVSLDGGSQPRWRSDGKELYFISPDAKLMAVAIEIRGESVLPGTPLPLFETRIFLGGAEQPVRGQYDVALDGRFLLNTVIDETAIPPIIVVQNWNPDR
jgi:Tol biopolymer transport system component